MRLFFLATLVLLTGCATQKILTPTGGSKADGTVVLSYEYGMFEQPIVDHVAAQALAKKRCAAWRYKNAEAFGSGTSDCLAYNGYGNCVRQRVNVIYQCTD